jgi:antitoxin YefM
VQARRGSLFDSGSAYFYRARLTGMGAGTGRACLGIDVTCDFAYALILGVTMTPPITASEARASLYRLIDQASESHQPILISGKRSSAVLVSADDWQSIQETLYLLSVPGMRESIQEGRAESLGKSAKKLDW